MKTTPWRDLKHKASVEEMESVRREAIKEAERLLHSQSLQQNDVSDAADHSGKAA